MEHNGYKAQIMQAPRLTGKSAHELPPGTPIDCYNVDQFLEPLPSWLKGPGNYVVPVEKDWAIWMDWTMNDEMNTAVVPTCKGMNPITGKRTNGVELETYNNKCPIHEIYFEGVRFCKECGYKWAPQNYIASGNRLWLDGWLDTKTGVVRQFVFTEDLSFSVPEQVIGKDDTVPAFGFAFYRTKVHRNPKERVRDVHHYHNQLLWWNNPYYYYGNYYGSMSTFFNDKITSGTVGVAFGYNGDSTQYKVKVMNTLRSASAGISGGVSASIVNSSGTVIGTSGVMYCSSNSSESNSMTYTGSDNKGSAQSMADNFDYEPLSSKVENVEVGVGAGAEIKQNIEQDTLSLSDWKETPDSIIRVNFIFVEQFEQLKAKGMKDLSGSNLGWMNGVKTLA